MNEKAQGNNRKYLLYILIIIFIVSFGILAFRVGSSIISYISAIKEEAKSKEEEFRAEQERIKNEIKKQEEEMKAEQERIKEEQKKQEEKRKVDSFNWKYEARSGSQTDGGVSFAIDDAITNAKKNNEHLIEFIFDGTSYGTDPNSIVKIKDSLRAFNSSGIQYYEVSFDYDSEGYINKAMITTR